MEHEIEFETNETKIMFYTTVVNLCMYKLAPYAYDYYLTYL
jgi:hypothetical protein